MTNSNCLEGFRCPNCGNEDRLFITATIWAEVTDDGAGIADGCDMDWDGTSMTRCPECGSNGPLSEFGVPDSTAANEARDEHNEATAEQELRKCRGLAKPVCELTDLLAGIPKP